MIDSGNMGACRLGGALLSKSAVSWLTVFRNKEASDIYADGPFTGPEIGVGWGGVGWGRVNSTGCMNALVPNTSTGIRSLLISDGAPAYVSLAKKRKSSCCNVTIPRESSQNGSRYTNATGFEHTQAASMVTGN